MQLTMFALKDQDTLIEESLQKRWLNYMAIIDIRSVGISLYWKSTITQSLIVLAIAEKTQICVTQFQEIKHTALYMGAHVHKGVYTR